MKKTKITMTVIKEDSGYSASAKVKDAYIATEGEDMDELKSNIVEAVNLTLGSESISIEYFGAEIWHT